MPTRLSRLLSKEKDAEAEHKASRSNSPPPLGYSEPPPGYDAEHTIQPPDVTVGFSNLSLSNKNKDGFPSPNECTAHLKLLECFYRLRQKVGSIDGLYGIHDSVVTKSGVAIDDNASGLLAKLAEKRWAIFVSRAVYRFEAWILALLPQAHMITIRELVAGARSGRLLDRPATAPLQFSKNNMPPVDVLMVWHAYMLNPRAYLEDSIRYGRTSLWHTPFPWSAAASCIDSHAFGYEVGETAKPHFEEMTSLPWHNLDMAGPRVVKCPTCFSDNPAQWTTCHQKAPRVQIADHKVLSAALDDMLCSGSGFCDQDFDLACPSCKTSITHERLKAEKFCADVRKLLNETVPMGGTILGTEGLPGRFNGEVDTSYKHLSQTTNRLISCGLGASVLNQPKLSGKGINESMQGIREMVENFTKDKTYMRKVRDSASPRMIRTEKIGIWRMMSRYWENHSSFALDLVGAVIRQGSFVEKMHNIDWLHSPALPSTMKRLIVKYERFVSIMKDPRSMAVPTLDVDLAWHTHQLDPAGYMAYTVKHTGQFVDHDDKVAETRLNDAFAWTSKTYQKLYKEPYSECPCWYCEAIRESHTSAVSRLFNTTSVSANDQVHSATQDPRKSVHISAHNAVRPTDESNSYQLSAGLKADALEKEYQKACERARKKGKKEPRRDDYYYSDAWGHPVYIPAYSPYVGYVPYAPMYYPVTPGCMALGAGAAGDCCAGTCGGGVAAGSCGGMTGGCGGPGGCGGGGGGGCGGGGGGGCGG
ncbi:large-conductance mechanosensitive channel [Teratosphaeria destructans]|uniref:Large-conductance mechanosensitive channel n=1 Tax=Teratosphaeria destructans TaxID=418781 RepID=A0A9W7ST68_9PEZI|nr:large-conductance mechanosensitive channel [Teratosphaeria destructans]